MSMHKEQWLALGSSAWQFIAARPIAIAIALGALVCVWLGYHLHK